MTLSIRPYQAEGLDFLVEHGRAAIFDEPGLGKTMQALLAMRDLIPEGRILVVCTGDAIGVWQEQIELWLDEYSTVYAGQYAKEDALYHDGFVITNYNRLATALDWQWAGVIFDESQMLRNRNTRTLFKAVRERFDKARFGFKGIPAFFLSGTPIVKAAGDVWPILHLIDKQRWNAFWPFVRKYSIFWIDDYGWHTEGVTNVNGLWAEVGSVALRRTKAEVQPDLPPKIRQRVPLTMTPRQAKAYRELEKDMIAEVDGSSRVAPDGGLLLTPSVLARETRLRQLLVSPRLLGIDDEGAGMLALREVAANGAAPFVIFTPFAEAIPLIEAALFRTKRPTYSVRGGMALGRLADSVTAFKASAKAGEHPILISSVQMSKSWSVSEVASECYMLEYDWNATTMTQAEDRLHRDGQTDTVVARYLVHDDTHDFDALEVVSGKRRLADVILDRARRRAGF